MSRSANPLDSAHYTRKAYNWSEADTDARRAVLHAAKYLPVFSTHGKPIDDFPEDRPQYHIAEVGDHLYLVDTQGFNYARYIARLPDEFYNRFKDE